MTKTVIPLETDVKLWLDNKAAQEGVPMTELVRRAIRLLQEQESNTVAKLLSDSAGLWQHGDGLAYQEAIRSEWSR